MIYKDLWNILIWIFIWNTYCDAIEYQKSVLNKSCTTPDKQEGKCIRLTSCPSLQNMLKRKDEPNTRNFLRNSHCGYEQRDVVVCCPSNTKPLIPKPSTATTLSTPTIASTLTTASVQTTSPDGLDERHKPPVLLDLNADEEILCGISNATKTRVIGGRDAELGSWPWIAALGYPYRGTIEYRCGGTLITEKHVVTAAHCIIETPVRPTQVRLGDLNLVRDDDGASPVDIDIDKIVTHEDYHQGRKLVNDIAMITLKNPVQFNRLIRPLCLPTLPSMNRSSTFYHRNLHIIGWGATVYGGTAAASLQEAQIPVYEDEKCKVSYREATNSLIDERVICAGGNGKDTCQGDSGGPLIASYGSTFYLIGIVSYGRLCGSPEHPGVYTKVPHFMNWIIKNTDTTICKSQPETCTKPENSRRAYYETLPCGKSNQTADDIVDGQLAKPGSWPWMVSLGFQLLNVMYLCNGVLISDRHILSSASCIQQEFRLVQVRMGVLDTQIYNRNEKVDAPVEGTVIHEDYNLETNQNDIGIVTLKKPVQFTSTIQPICLPLKPEFESSTFQGKPLLTASWGNEIVDVPTTETIPLRETKMSLYDNKRCKDRNPRITIDERHICAARSDSSTCHADRGDQLVTIENGTFYTIGILILKENYCDDPSNPYTYTKIVPYLDWIIENTKQKR